MLSIGQQTDADQTPDDVAAEHRVAADRRRQPTVDQPEHQVKGDRRKQRGSEAQGDVPGQLGGSVEAPMGEHRRGERADRPEERSAEDDRCESFAPAPQAEEEARCSPQDDENRPDDLHRRRPVGGSDRQGDTGDDSGQRRAEQAVGGTQLGERRRRVGRGRRSRRGSVPVEGDHHGALSRHLLSAGDKGAAWRTLVVPTTP